ncbi:YdcF family protein [Patescibacteria group bacterium]|nr:YdcF family protein [Patescibacteria group bacterium]
MLPNASHFRLLMRFSSIAILFVSFVFCAVLLRIVTQFNGSHPQYPVECGLVFGAAVGKGSTPSAALTRRVEKAAELYNAKYIKTLIFSGGKGSEWQESEAAVMRKVAMLNGVDPDDIVLEEESTSTWENLEFSKSKVYECTAIVAISDRYHLARILQLAKKQNWINIESAPARRMPSPIVEVKSVLREAVGIIYYALNGDSLIDYWENQKFAF